MEKKGLSAVVGTVILIGLVVGAIALVWVVVSNLVEDELEGIESDLNRISLIVTDVSWDVDSQKLKVKVLRDAGEGDLVKIKFIFDGSTGRKSVEEDAGLEQLDEVWFDLVVPSGVGALEKISLAPIIKTESGKESLGHVTDVYEVEEIIFWQEILFENFENGIDPETWSTYSSELNGEIAIWGDESPRDLRHLLMHMSIRGNFNLNELTTKIDFTDYNNMIVSFWVKETADEDHSCPSSWATNHFNGDCVAITCDGTTWYKIFDLTDLTNEHTYKTADITSKISTNCGGNLDSNFKIKFQQYDNESTPSDGIFLDDITITAG